MCDFTQPPAAAGRPPDMTALPRPRLLAAVFPIALAVSLSSLAGCAADAQDATDVESDVTSHACLFGKTYADLDAPSAKVRTTVSSVFSTADIPTLSALQKQQFVLAVQQSAHKDVTTVEAAFAAVDGHTMNKRELYDEAGARTFTAIEYGAGDNSYGAIFVGRTATLAAAIHDGDLASCKAYAQTCAFGSTFQALRTSHDFTLARTRTIKDAAGLTITLQAQIVRAAQESRPDVTTIADAIAAADDRTINVYDYVEKAGQKRTFIAVEYGAGDNSYGAIFTVRGKTPSAVINDGDLFMCSVFR
jgi:hypothetical protein